MLHEKGRSQPAQRAAPSVADGLATFARALPRLQVQRRQGRLWIEMMICYAVPFSCGSSHSFEPLRGGDRHTPCILQSGAGHWIDARLGRGPARGRSRCLDGSRRNLKATRHRPSADPTQPGNHDIHLLTASPSEHPPRTQRHSTKCCFTHPASHRTALARSICAVNMPTFNTA